MTPIRRAGLALVLVPRGTRAAILGLHVVVAVLVAGFVKVVAASAGAKVGVMERKGEREESVIFTPGGESRS